MFTLDVFSLQGQGGPSGGKAGKAGKAGRKKRVRFSSLKKCFLLFLATRCKKDLV